jgi:hypothetical protein
MHHLAPDGVGQIRVCRATLLIFLFSKAILGHELVSEDEQPPDGGER